MPAKRFGANVTESIRARRAHKQREIVSTADETHALVSREQQQHLPRDSRMLNL